MTSIHGDWFDSKDEVVILHRKCNFLLKILYSRPNKITEIFVFFLSRYENTLRKSVVSRAVNSKC